MALILVVDDDEIIRDTLFELLSEQYVCQTAETAEKAFARLQADSYDVVLTDISMPGLSGVELLGHIRQTYSDTPVIMISGIGDQEHAEGLIRLGAFDFLLKPFSLEVVEESVQRAVEYRQQLMKGLSASELTSKRDGENDGPSEWKIVKE
jgi:two-component system response regulator PilR (NtrC family)